MQKAIVIILIAGLATIISITRSYPGWVSCPEGGREVQVLIQSPVNGEYTIKIPYNLASRNSGEYYSRYTRHMNSWLQLWSATPCLGKFWLIYEYGARIESIKIDGITLILDRNINSHLITEWNN